jgi:hypothetical protein
VVCSPLKPVSSLPTSTTFRLPSLWSIAVMTIFSLSATFSVGIWAPLLLFSEISRMRVPCWSP